MKTFQELDEQFDAPTLEFIRKHVHQTIVKKLSVVMTRADYMLYFDPSFSQGDFAFYAGKPIAIIIKSSPYDGETVRSLVTRVFSNKYMLRQMLRTVQLVKRSDAMLIYGAEYETLVNKHIMQSKNDTSIERYQCELLANFIKVEVKDLYTGKTIRLEAKNTDVFTLQERAIQLLRRES